jgi:glycosyltransferase involved in cell wall biosynthesis
MARGGRGDKNAGVMSPQFALGRADVFLIPSRYGGVGLPLAEAAVAGLPAVISDVKGLQWARTFPRAFAADDTVGAWRDAIARAIAMPEQAAAELPFEYCCPRVLE